MTKIALDSIIYYFGPFSLEHKLCDNSVFRVNVMISKGNKIPPSCNANMNMANCAKLYISC